MNAGSTMTSVSSAAATAGSIRRTNNRCARAAGGRLFGAMARDRQAMATSDEIATSSRQYAARPTAAIIIGLVT